jgi:hypothetical protein
MYGRRVLTLAVVALGLTVAPVRAVDQKAIDEAIDRGVKLIQGVQGRDGSWRFNQQGMSPGATALCALTLLECGVKDNDRSIEAAATLIRDAAPTLTKTYSVATAIMFLDRLGDNRDVPLIESLTVRLLAGQTQDGGWWYDCPSISDDEVTRLQTVVKNRNELKAGPLPSKRTSQDLPKEIQNQLQSIQRGTLEQKRMPIPPGGGLPQPGPGAMMMGMSDNSNTQFATLALWIGRRQGLPVDAALAKIDARHRRMQNRDGSWGYMTPPAQPGMPMMMGAPPSPSMTCSGILGLVMAHGVIHDPDTKLAKGDFDPAKDMALANALLALGNSAIGNPGDQPIAVNQINGNGKFYYYLWSLERVAMALNLERINKKDWYGWGAELLLANQAKDGGWYGEYGDNGSCADTCFALLFLKRSNLLKDISTSLKGKLKDPALSTTLTGGVGGIPSGRKPGDSLKSALVKETKFDDPRGKKEKPKLDKIDSRADDSKEGRLANKLLDAKGGEFKTILKELEETKGPEYHKALALAIPHLQGEPHEQARDALGNRMLRIKAEFLPKYLADANAEIRRAAVIAAGLKDPPAKQLIPDIIERLNDGETTVVYAAAAILKRMTNEDFGPALGANPEEHAKAVKDWKAWWEKNKGK